MDKKKILFYYKLFFAGGTEHSILKLVKKIYEDFDIYIAYDEDSTDNVLNELAQYSKIIDLRNIEDITADTCIWCSHSRQSNFEDFSKKVKAKHYFYWCHLLFFETFPNVEFSDDLKTNIEKFICVSKNVKKDITSKYPELESKCEVIENYLDVQEIIKKSNEQTELEVNKNKLNIISVSRIAKDKGFGRMKELCDIFDKENVCYDWYVLGSAYKQEDFNEISGWFRENENVHFLGYKSNVYPYIKQMDYLALLTDREAWGLVITEALMLGVPCITTNFAGVENQIADKENGIILDMTNQDDSYKKRVSDILQLKDMLKDNVRKRDYHREYIIDRWTNLLNEREKNESIER